MSTDNDYIDAEIELEAIDQQRLVNVSLYDHLIAEKRRQLTQVSKQHDRIPLRGGHRLGDVDCTLFAMLFVIVRESFLILRECKAPWNDVEHLWVDSRAYLKQAIEGVLMC